jgi:hypothetical protein
MVVRVFGKFLQKHSRKLIFENTVGQFSKNILDRMHFCRFFLPLSIVICFSHEEKRQTKEEIKKYQKFTFKSQKIMKNKQN